MVQRVNAHKFGDAAALFATASRLSHSCRPNCRAVEHDGELEIWSLRRLGRGEPLCISYMQDDMLLFMDTASRRRHLWNKFCFICRCSRCCNPDDSRQFLCTCGGAMSPAEASLVPAPE